MMMKPTHKTPNLRALLREHVPLEPEHELHAQSLALLAEIEAALDEADVKSGCAVLCGDSLDVLKTLPDNSVHAVVTDPPYGLGDTSPAQVAECMLAWARGETWTPKGSGFMGKSWDAWVPPPELWREVLRVLKPGGHALVFAGSRTQDLMSLSLRLAGFEIRDTLQWLYGSGFPKSLNIAKNMDWTQAPPTLSKVYEVTKWIREARDAAGIKNKDIDAATNTQMAGHWTSSNSQPQIPEPHQVPALLKALKLTAEQVPEHIAPYIVTQEDSLREVLGEAQYTALTGYVGRESNSVNLPIYGAPVRTEAQQWEGWGTALKPAFEPVIMARKPLKGTVVQNTLEHGCGGINVDGCRVAWSEGEDSLSTTRPAYTPHHSAVVNKNASDIVYSDPTRQLGRWPANVILDPEAGALLDTQAGEPVSRYFYCAKASRAEREAGLQGHETGSQPRANIHPTVKPINLMRYLVRLVTPSHGTILDPFTGSGSTGCAAVLERVNFIGIERETDYARIARARIAHHMHQDADIDQDDLFSALDEADEQARNIKTVDKVDSTHQ
jgi:DNA modification methylase